MKRIAAFAGLSLLGLLVAATGVWGVLALAISGPHDDTAVANAVLGAGADGVVLKRAIATDLPDGVDAVLAGSRYLLPWYRFGDTQADASARYLRPKGENR